MTKSYDRWSSSTAPEMRRKDECRSIDDDAKSIAQAELREGLELPARQCAGTLSRQHVCTLACHHTGALL
jgi:hypothetical protein